MPNHLRLAAPPRTRVAAALPAALVGLLAASGCAGDRERAARIAWDEAWSGFAAGPAAVAPVDSTTPLARYLDVALARSPGLQAQAQRWRAELERAPQARALPEPRLTYGGWVEPVETRVGPMRHAVGGAQAVPWPGKLLAEAEVAVEEAAAAEARLDVDRLRLVRDVTRAYGDYYYLGRQAALTREILDLVEHWEKVAQARIRAGMPAAHRDAVKAQVEIGRLEDRLATLEDMADPEAERLRRLLDLPPDFPIPAPAALPAAALAREPAAVAALLPGSPLLREQDRRVAARERGVELAGQRSAPDLMAGFEYVVVGPARGSGRVRGDGDDALRLNVGLSLPVWWGAYGAGVREAEARLRAADLERRDLANDLEARLSRVLFAYRDAARKLRFYRDSLVPKAQQSLEVAATAFESGDGDFLDVLDAERALLELELVQERARADRLIHLSELELIVGEPLSAPAGGPR